VTHEDSPGLDGLERPFTEILSLSDARRFVSLRANGWALQLGPRPGSPSAGVYRVAGHLGKQNIFGMF
jgi:hypothetical protein